MEITYYLFLIYITAVYGNPCLNQTLSTVPHPYNCNTFIVCWMSKPFFQACPIGSLFDTTKNNCQPWPIAICCNFIYPKLRRILPPIPSRPSGTLERRTLPPIPDIFVTKLIPDNIATTFESTQTLPPIISTSETKGDNGTIGETSVESGDSKVSSVIKIYSTVTKGSTETGTLATISAHKTTSPPIISTSHTKSATAITDDKSAELTISTVSITTEINSSATEENTVPGTLVTVASSKKRTLSPISPTSEDNGATAITDDKSVESNTSVVSIITEINSTVNEANTETEALTTVAQSKKHTFSPMSPTFDGNGAPAIIDDKSIKSNTSKVSSITEINSTVSEPSTETGTIASMSASKNTVPPKYTNSKTKGSTYITGDTSVKSDHSKVSSTIEINSSVTEANTVPGKLATVASSKKRILSPISTTSEGNEATAITGNKSVESTTSKVSGITEINPTVTEPNTKTGKLTTISASKNTVPHIISTSGTKGATVITDDKSVESTTPVVSNITEINSTVTEANTETETLTTVAFSTKETLSPISPTSEGNGATAIPDDKSVESTTSKVSFITEITSTVTEPNTETSTLATISTSKNTVPPIISTSDTKGATAITDDNAAESSTFIMSNITEINSSLTEANTVPGTPATVAFSKKETLSPISPTSEGNGATAIPDDKSVESTTSKVSGITEITSTVTEPNTENSTLATISTSKNTVPPIISTSDTKGATAITDDNAAESSTFIMSNITEINSSLTEANTVPGTPATVAFSKKETLSPISPTSEGNGASTITDDKSVKSITSKVSSITEINSSVTEANTETETLTTVALSKTHTLSPMSPTSKGNGATAVIDYKSIESTTSKESNITEINSTVSEPNTETGTLDTISLSENTASPKYTNSETKGSTYVTSDTSVESDNSKVSSTIEINSSVTEANTVPGTLATAAVSKKRTLSPISPSSEGTTIIDNKYVESTTSVVSIITEINSTLTESSPKTGTLATISASENTVPPIYSTSETKRATGITGEISVETDNYKVSSITEIHSMVTDLNTVPGTLATVTSSKQQTLRPPSSTSETNLATSMSGDAYVELDLIEMSSITEIYSMVTDLKTVPITLGEDATSKQQTLSPLSPTSEANGATFMTHDTSVESDNSKGSSTKKINSTVTGANPVPGTLATVAVSKKQTLSSVSSNSEGNGFTSIADDKSVESTTTILSSVTEINSTITKPSTESGTLTTIYASKNNAPPIISTSHTKGASAITNDKAAESTISIVSITTEINPSVTEQNTILGTLATVASSKKLTLSPIIPTTKSNGATALTDDKSVESTTSKVSSTTEINSTVTKQSTETSTLASISASENTVQPIISNSVTKGATAITDDMAPESTTSIMSNITEINSSVTEANTFPETPATVAFSKKETLSLISPTSEGNGASTITDDKSVKSTTSKVSSITETNSSVTEANTVPETLATVTSNKKRTLSPISPTSKDNGPTALTDDKSVESTTSKVSGITEINLTVTEPKTETGTLASKKTIPPVISTSEINGAKAMIHETSVESGTSKITIITETNLIVTEPTTLSDTPANISADLSQSKEITKQEKKTLHNKRTLSPMPITSNVPCPYYGSLTTSEVPIEPQLPDCRINDNFVYPDLVNCNYYYNCFNGIMQRLHCKPSFGFNPHLMKCIPEEYAKCGLYKSASDQKTFLISFLLFNHMRKKTEYELKINKFKLNL